MRLGRAVETLILELKPPVIASTRPVWGSIATIPPCAAGIWRRPKVPAGSPALGVLGHRLDQDDIALGEHVAGLLRLRPEPFAFQPLPRPFDLGQGNAAPAAIGDADFRMVGGHLEHGGKPPDLAAGRDRRLGQLLRPIVEAFQLATGPRQPWRRS